jgi:hypothetical protein
MEKFSDVLLSLENVENVQRIELYDDEGNLAGAIHNKPGSQGSLKVYHHLYKTYGGITLDAAVEGLSLYAEHTQDAENSPGKHPNIDRLLEILEDDAPLTVKIVPTEA